MCRTLLATTLAILVLPIAGGADWPTWRCDAQRSGVSPDDLPGELAVRWTLAGAAPRPAWPDPRLQFDRVAPPAIAGRTLVVASSRTDTVTAVESDSGAPRWRFVAAGPVRVPPAIAGGRVFVASDGGELSCLDLDSGKRLWSFDGATSRQQVLGNERLISMWPARGGPVVHEGVVYFTAGVWPFMGVFVYAIDADTGRLVWHNDRPSSAYNTVAGAGDGTFGSASPQGALAIAGGQLAVPSGRAWPAYFELSGGAMAPHAAGIKDTSGGGDSQIAVAGDYLIMGGCVFSRSQQRALLFNASTPTVAPFTALAVLDRTTLYASDSGGLVAHDLAEAKLAKLAGAYGRPLARCDTRELWRLPLGDRVEVLIKAGRRLYAAGEGWVAAVEPAADGASARVAWRGQFAGTAGDLAAADGKLFVSTRQGAVHCFAAADGRPPAVYERPCPAPPPPPSDRVAEILAAMPTTEGYALCVGVRDEQLVEELARRSRLHVVVLEEDAQRRQQLQTRWLDAGLYGDRIAVLDAPVTALPPYVVGVIVCQRLSSSVAELIERLHPYGGRLFLTQGLAPSGPLPGVRRLAAGSMTLLVREGGLPDAADWTHDAADGGNTWMSRDQRVKAPLGVLWYGGPAGDPRWFMQRHADPPGARVCQGRLFIHGDNLITAVDAYTGRLLWQRPLPDVPAYQNVRSNVQAGPPFEKTGETNKRAALVAHPEGLYLAYGRAIHVWDPASGETRAEYRVPDPSDPAVGLPLADLRLEGDVLVAGAGFAGDDREAVFVAADFADMPPEQQADTAALLEQWAGDRPPPREASQGVVERLVVLGNHLLRQPGLEARVPESLRRRGAEEEKSRAAVEAARREIDRQQAIHRQAIAPYVRAEHARRKLLEAYLPGIRALPPKMHWANLYPWDGTSTRYLAALDRATGRLLWRTEARYAYPQKALAVGPGRVFCLDRSDPDVDDVLRRRGLVPHSQPRLMAWDLRTGRQAWSRQEEVAGYELFYSARHDVLVQASQHDPAPQLWWSKPRELSVRFLAVAGADGRTLWDQRHRFTRPGGGHRLWHNWFLHDDTIILESYRDKDAEFYGFDLLTGATRQRIHPLTGRSQPWGFRRMGGCTKNLCCPNLVLFRSHSAGYYDMTADGGTASLGGFRPGCKNSLIPAAGLLNAPNYASGCTCNYPVMTSLALVHMPQAEAWATNDFRFTGGRVQRLGINLGAPGDRRADDGTLWLDYPSVGGASPDVPVSAAPQDVAWFYRHSSRIAGEVPGWIVASGGEGLETLRVRLTGPEQSGPSAPRPYTVRLYFAEPRDHRPGERTFDVLLQGREVLREFDVAAAAGGVDRGAVREFTGVTAGDELQVRLVARRGRTLLCGIEIVASSPEPAEKGPP